MAHDSEDEDTEGTVDTVVEGKEPKAPRREVEESLDEPRKIGRYVLLSRLGKGGMGTVYKAYDPQLNRQIALKLVHVQGGARERAETRLQREAQALAQLDHENVVKVYDVGEVGEDIFIAMELVRGTTLRRWLKDTPRSRAEIMATFAAAGRGLAAAHDAGLIHRDFKPANVAVGTDGRVRVLDFGLARTAGRDARLEGSGSTDRELSSSTSASGDSASPLSGATDLTVAGQVIGTPAYMAPEQHRGEAADARSDQFAFAVALFEALYGARPHGEGGVAETRERVLSGAIVVPAGKNVPAHVHRALMKALHRDERERFASMHELLAELLRDPWARWRRAGWAAAAVAVLAALVVFGVRAQRGPAQGCAEAAARIEGTWGPPHRAALAASLGAIGPIGREANARVTAALDRYAADWAAMTRDSCEATRVRGTQSEQVLDLRAECLARRQGLLDALVTLVAKSPPREVARWGVEAATGLPTLAECADADSLRDRVPRPASPAARVAVEKAWKVIDSAEALWRAGKWDEAWKEGTRARTAAAGIDYAPLVAALEFTLARIADDREENAEAERLYFEALGAAAAAKQDVLVAEIWMRLFANIGYDQAQGQRAEPMARAARIALARAGEPPLMLADMDHNAALVLLYADDAAAGLELARKAYEARKKLLGDHPEVASSLNVVGMFLANLGRYDESQVAHAEVLRIRAQVLGPHHPFVADSYNNIGTTLYHRGKLDAALASYEQAFAIQQAILPPGHKDLGTTLNNMGGVYLDQGRLDDADRAYRAALALWQAALGPDHPDLAIVLFNLGDLGLKRGQPVEAYAECERALRVEEATLGKEHANLAYDLTCMGRALVAQKRAAEAVPVLERALALVGEGGDPIDRATTQFALAQALAASAPGRARRLAEEAEKAFAAAGERGVTDLAQVRAWLGTR